MRPYLPVMLSVLCAAAAVLWFLRPAPEAAASYRNGDRLTAGAQTAGQTAKEINWDQLMPADWDPYLTLKGLDLAKLQDGDPKARAAMDQARERWNKAPVVHAFDNQLVRIPGFLIPLDAEGEAIHSFLLVPYFGACIHTPPPPANQIIEVKSSQAVANARMMDAVWVTGRLKVEAGDSMFGPVGYRIDASAVSPYVKPAGGR